MKGAFLLLVFAVTLWFAVWATEPRHPTLILPWVPRGPGVAGCGPRGCFTASGVLLDYPGACKPDGHGEVTCWFAYWHPYHVPPWGSFSTRKK